MPESPLQAGATLTALSTGWFDAGTTVRVIDDCRELGVIAQGRRFGEEDQELCCWDEFEDPDVAETD